MVRQIAVPIPNQSSSADWVAVASQAREWWLLPLPTPALALGNNNPYDTTSKHMA
jgi:hypothetical protein